MFWGSVCLSVWRDGGNSWQQMVYLGCNIFAALLLCRLTGIEVGGDGNEKDSVEAKTECKKEPVKGKIVVIWLIFVLVGIAGYCNMTSLRTQENFAKCAAGVPAK